MYVANELKQCSSVLSWPYYTSSTHLQPKKWTTFGGTGTIIYLGNAEKSMNMDTACNPKQPYKVPTKHI